MTENSGFCPEKYDFYRLGQQGLESSALYGGAAQSLMDDPMVRDNRNENNNFCYYIPGGGFGDADSLTISEGLDPDARSKFNRWRRRTTQEINEQMIAEGLNPKDPKARSMFTNRVPPDRRKIPTTQKINEQMRSKDLDPKNPKACIDFEEFIPIVGGSQKMDCQDGHTIYDSTIPSELEERQGFGMQAESFYNFALPQQYSEFKPQLGWGNHELVMGGEGAGLLFDMSRYQD